LRNDSRENFDDQSQVIANLPPHRRRAGKVWEVMTQRMEEWWWPEPRRAETVEQDWPLAAEWQW